MNGRAKIHYFLQLYRKSVISVSLRHFLSDPRPRVTRPAPAGHTTCARGSRDLRPRVAGNLGERNGNTGL